MSRGIPVEPPVKFQIDVNIVISRLETLRDHMLCHLKCRIYVIRPWAFWRKNGFGLLPVGMQRNNTVIIKSITMTL